MQASPRRSSHTAAEPPPGSSRPPRPPVPIEGAVAGEGAWLAAEQLACHPARVRAASESEGVDAGLARAAAARAARGVNARGSRAP